ncbi:MAG: conjugal transfer protein TraL [Oscillospiraceae bacterium]|nr:conjugal transfer protein TraL [Oscillospiraceae bacterium]
MLEKKRTNYTHEIAAFLVIFAALALRLAMFENTSPDYNQFLSPWMEEFRRGGFLAIKNSTSNYPLSYLYILALFSYFPVKDLYLIKLLSILFDFVIAFTLSGMVRGDRKRSDSGLYEIFVLALVLFWPTFWLNSAYWAQCDSIYAAFCLLAYSAALKGRPMRSVIYAGIAFAFKLQSVFFLPFLGVLWIAKKIKIRHALLFPIPFILTSIPALLMGLPLSRIIGIYTEQMGLYSGYLTLNAPSVFAIFTGVPKDPFFLIGIVTAGIYVVLMLVLAFFQREHFDGKLFAAFAFSICIGVVWFLPSMHERYFYLAEMFAILFAVLNPKRWYLAALTLFGSLAGYHAYLVLGKLSDNLWLASVIMLIAVIGAVWSCAAQSNADEHSLL